MVERETEYSLSRSSRGQRKRRLVEKRKKRRRRYFLYVLIALLAIGLIGYGVSRLSIKIPTKTRTGNKNSQPVKSENGQTSKKGKEKRVTFLIAGANKVDGKEEAEGILVLVLNETKKQLFAITIPGNTLVDIPGLGFEKASLALSSDGMDGLYITMKNFLGVPLDYRVKLEYENFKYFLDRNSFDSMVLKSKDTNLKKSDEDKYSKAIAKVELKNTKKIPLPVKPLMMENKVYFEPIHESIDSMIEEVFGIKKEASKVAARVVILNGCGVPGIAAKVAEKLVENGYKITESKNADNFNYKTTQIISFKADLTVAKRIREVLGIGEVVRKRAPQDLVDIAVIIGRDYPKGD